MPLADTFTPGTGKTMQTSGRNASAAETAIEKTCEIMSRLPLSRDENDRYRLKEETV